MTLSKLLNKKCAYCGYKTTDSKVGDTRGIVIFRETIKKYVCTECMMRVPRHIPNRQLGKYLDLKKERKNETHK